MLTSYDQAGGSGKVLAMDETHAQLQDHQVFVKSLADSAGASKASPADVEAQKGINDSLKGMKTRGVLISGPGPGGVASGDGVQLAADGSIIGTAKKGVHFSTLKRFTVAARDVLSMFSQKGMSLITAAGDFVAQAQRGRMQLASQGDMTVETVDGVLHVKSSKEIVLNVGGSYLRMTPEGIEFGSRGVAEFKTSGLKKVGPAQMDLGGEAFAPAFVPYTTQCEVWRSNPDFFPSTESAPVPDAAQWESLGNTGAVAPAPIPSSQGSQAAAETTTPTPSGSGDVTEVVGVPLADRLQAANQHGIAKVKLDNPEDVLKTKVDNHPAPLKLENAAPCSWTLAAIKAARWDAMESKQYLAVETDRKPSFDSQQRRGIGGGARQSVFDLNYSDDDKTVTFLLRMMLIPMDLYPVDALGNRDVKAIARAVQYESGLTVPYYSGDHASMNPGSVLNNLKMDYRENIGAGYVIATIKQNVEQVLNQGAYKLVLDGCSKGSACGCRVKVNFEVDIRISIRGVAINGFDPHIKLSLFPYVMRADTSAWGEGLKIIDTMGGYVDHVAANIEAHEVGHYFNFPDEYFGGGGFLHEAYIRGDEIDFEKVDRLAGDTVWQGYSKHNLMGDGAWTPVSGGGPTASIKPYYLEYARQHFADVTGKNWRIGYES